VNPRLALPRLKKLQGFRRSKSRPARCSAVVSEKRVQDVSIGSDEGFFGTRLQDFVKTVLKSPTTYVHSCSKVRPLSRRMAEELFIYF
jgi:hypothetical protein